MSTSFALLILLLGLLAGCNRDSGRTAPIADGYVGPMTLNVREDLTPRSPTVATIKHGERVEIVQRRRRFARVRTSAGAEGWIDGRQLLTSDQMGALNSRSSQYAKAPSMGTAVVHDALNLHTEPNRQSPSFHQIPAAGSAEVLAHKLAPRVAYQPPVPAAPPKPAPPKKRKKESDEKLAKPPMPKAPPLPEDWLELSKTPVVEEEVKEGEEAEEKAPEAPSVRFDDWSLVRTPEGKVGWVLTRALIMAIPDEVAQYAEGDRITSYFSLGKVADEGQVKDNWLWTTISQNEQPYQFDGFRVFIYNPRRHRYETAYIERNLKGYFPVQATPQGASNSAGFSLVVEDKDGQLYRRTYEFQGYRVRMIAKEPWTPPTEGEVKGAPVRVASAPNTEGSVFGRIKEKLFGR